MSNAVPDLFLSLRAAVFFSRKVQMLLSESWLSLHFTGEDDLVWFNSSLPVCEEEKKIEPFAVNFKQ